MDVEFIVASLPLYVKAAKLTVELAFWGIIFSLLIGLICSIVTYCRINIVRQVVMAYIELARNTPLLIQLFFLYYGLAQLGIKLEAYTCAVLGLSFLGGGYMAEAFRAGMEAVGKAQVEAGLSVALTRWQVIRYIVLPQAIAISIPAIAANAIFLLKETSVVSAIALADLMFVAKDLIGMYYKTTEALLLLVGAYLILLLPLSVLARWLERRLRYAEHGVSCNS